jgi:hypothetical protein
MSAHLENPANRYIGLSTFRDSAKTTLARAYIMKRIAYCISRTIMAVNISAPKAQHTTRWLMRQIEFNRPFAQAFKLRKGDKWTPEWFTCINAEDQPVNVVASGITSGLRGLNIEDYRPDFIFADDISDRENTATEDQRAKANETFFAQLVRSLAPRSEAPLSQLALGQTPINSYDIISQAGKDPQFKVFKYSCFDASGQSSWAARRSTDELLAEKQGYINRNMLSLWLAEMECELVSGETQSFEKRWLRYFTVFPGEGQVVICIDPASSEEAKADFFAIVVLLFHGANVYLLEYTLQRGMMPDAACAYVFEYALRYGARDVVVETVAYQKILKWYLEQEIQKRRIWLTVHKYDDKRNKDDRMVQAITQVAPYGNLWVREEMSEFLEVFELYGPGYGGKVDLLDAVSIGISWKMKKGQIVSDYEGEFRRLREEDEELDGGKTSFMGAP